MIDQHRPAHGAPWLAAAALVSGVAAVVVLPVLLGPLGLLLGYFAQQRGSRLGGPAMAVAGVGMVLGLVTEGLLS